MLVGAGCYLGATSGNLLQFPQTGTAIFFPPYAILTAALLVSSTRRWWIYLLAASAGNFWSHYLGGATATFALTTELANQARALVAAYGIRRLGDARGRFDTLRGMGVFVLFAAVLAPSIGALVGAGIVMANGRSDQFWLTWREWLLSNTVTGLTLLPVFLIKAVKPIDRWSEIPGRRLLEGGALSILILAVGRIVLLLPGTIGGIPVPLYAPLPLLLWAAVRFGPEGTSASLLLVAVLTVWGMVAGRGPFVTRAPLGDLVHVQLFLFATSMPLLLLSALIREQRRTASALGTAQDSYRAVVEDQSELVTRFLPDGTITFVNGACCRAAGRSPEELSGASFWVLVPAEQKSAAKKRLTGLDRDHPFTSWEHEVVKNDEERRWEQWRVRAIFDALGNVVDYHAVGRDITERKRAEEADRLLAAERIMAETLREADSRKDEFLAVLAHELRNPLAPITMVLEVLRQRESNDENVRWARELIGRQVGQLTRLVEDLLDISRIAGGKIQLQMEKIDIRDVIRTAVETSQPNLLARQIDFHLEIGRAPLLVLGDSARIAQLVSNLLNNAAKYTPSGGRVDLTAFREDAHIVVRCLDEGAGIPAHMLSRVFEPFMQVDRSRDGKLGGLGLGLALVKRLVEIHAGTVEAHSAGPGTGSRFEVRLPSLQPSANERSDLRIDIDSLPTSIVTGC